MQHAVTALYYHSCPTHSSCIPQIVGWWLSLWEHKTGFRSVDMSFTPEYVVLPQEPWIIGCLVAHTLLLLAVIIFRRHQRVTAAIFLFSSADLYPLQPERALSTFESRCLQCETSTAVRDDYFTCIAVTQTCSTYSNCYLDNQEYHDGKKLRVAAGF